MPIPLLEKKAATIKKLTAALRDAHKRLRGAGMSGSKDDLVFTTLLECDEDAGVGLYEETMKDG